MLAHDNSISTDPLSTNESTEEIGTPNDDVQFICHCEVNGCVHFQSGSAGCSHDENEAGMCVKF